ncbi:MAG: LpxI family protein [Candidatus Omnitrophica bacterium]|nr:LpxI family protein [Candidatus Omnitrophota bacterium]
MERIGLIAGNRKLPLLFSEAARRKGYSLVAIAIKGDTSAALRQYVDKIYWLGLDEFSSMFDIFKSEGITKVVMAGQISPQRLFSKEVQRDKELKTLLESIKNKKADTIFGAITQRLEKFGLELLSSTTFIEELLVKKGTLSLRKPSFTEWEDIYFGLELAKSAAYLDIGQTVAVKEKAIVAVEALEGTDNLIRRAGKLARKGVTVVKVSKPKQDLRFDIPVIGLNTMKNIVSCGVSCLAIEAEKTIFIDKEKSLALADRRGISVVAV